MQISNNYIAVDKLEEPKQEGFQTVEITDSSLFKGVITHIPEQPVYMGNTPLAVGDVILFAKYSPDTHEIEHDGKKLKFISTRDILAKL